MERMAVGLRSHDYYTDLGSMSKEPVLKRIAMDPSLQTRFSKGTRHHQRALTFRTNILRDRHRWGLVQETYGHRRDRCSDRWFQAGQDGWTWFPKFADYAAG